MRNSQRLAAVLMILAATACSEGGEELISIDAKGVVVGIAYLDRDGNAVPTPNIDTPIRNLQVGITTNGGVIPVATTMTDSLGVFSFNNLPVGTYRVVATSNPPGDSIAVVSIDSSRVTVSANDTAGVFVTLGYSTSRLSAIKAMPRGRRIAVTATALNGWAAFGDSTVHIADSTGAIRVAGIRPANINAGDRIRVIATVGDRDGHVALVDPTIVSVQIGELPTPLSATTAAARIAGGVLDAAQVQILKANVLDASSLAGGDVMLTVDDGSGPLEVLVDANANIGTTLPVAPGAELDVTGVLVPEPASTRWRLKPRRTGDIIVRYPPVSIATARARQPGTFVVIQGIALNNLSTFGDLTLHVKDASGTIRVIASRSAFISAGDSVSVLGAVQLVQGQPTLTGATPSVIVRRVVPEPDLVSTLIASTADNGRLDAALVRVTGTVSAVDTLAAEIRITVNDGSGAVAIFIDPDAAINISTPAVNARVTITGVLVPIGVRTWGIKPRTASDITVN